MSINSVREKLIEGLILDIPLPPKPEILLRFVRERERDELDLEGFGNIISNDMALALAIIKTVNSSFFGLEYEVRSVNHAISMLGLENIENLVLAFSLERSLSQGDSFLLNQFWETNRIKALIGSSLATSYTRISSDLAYTFCLICDCGVPAIMRKEQSYAEFYAGIADKVSEDHVTQEEDIYMYNHAQVGAHLLKEWLVPEDLILGVKYHHHTDLHALDITHEVKVLIALQHLASDIFSRFYHNESYYYWSNSMGQSLDLLDITDKGLAGIEKNFKLLLDEL
ncbi:MAG: HDOD domain-containing protein [Fibrobacterales bacterium]